MTEPHSDSRCQIEMQGVPPMRVKDLFPKKAGPTTEVILNSKNKAVEEFAQKFYSDVQAARRLVTRKAGDDDVAKALEDDMKKNSKERRANLRPRDAPKRPRKTSLTISMATT